MRNYFNLLLEKERISVWPAILRGTKYGFIVNYIGQIIVLSFVAFSNLGGSPDTFTLYTLLAIIMSPVKNPDLVLIPSLPVTKKMLKKWNMQIHCLYLSIMLPFSFILYFATPFHLEDPSPWFVAESPTIIVFITGWLTGILLSYSLRLFIDLDPFRFIKIKYLRNLLIVPVFFLGIYAIHYLNLWLIGLW